MLSVAILIWRTCVVTKSFTRHSCKGPGFHLTEDIDESQFLKFLRMHLNIFCSSARFWVLVAVVAITTPDRRWEAKAQKGCFDAFYIIAEERWVSRSLLATSQQEHKLKMEKLTVATAILFVLTDALAILALLTPDWIVTKFAGDMAVEILWF